MKRIPFYNNTKKYRILRARFNKGHAIDAHGALYSIAEESYRSPK